MTKVLIPCRGVCEDPKRLPPVLGVRSTYLVKLYAQKLVPIFAPPGMPEEAVEELYGECSGLLLTGGEDVDPSFYGETSHPKTKSSDYGRDELELTLAKTFLADKKPILGICRGCQVLAVAAGGSLIQHLPDVIQNETHDSGAMIENDNIHPASFAAESKIAQVCKKTSVMVNSYHHQSVLNPGQEMLATGHSPKGVIESIEHRDRRFFCIGVQSHPENETGDLEALFEAFATACRAFR